jgi:hypothetical protein
MSHWKSSMLCSPRSHAARLTRDAAHNLAFPSLAVLQLTVAFLCASDTTAADKVAAKLSVADAVTTPGRPILLEARLVRDGSLIETGLGGEPVDFLISNRKIGTTMTGGDGRAYLEYTPKMRGNQTLTVRLGPSTRVEASEATATVAAWEKRRPILLIEQSALLKESSAGGPLPGLGLGISHQDPAEEPGASSELKKLAEFYFNLVYVERPGDKAPEGLDLRDWLQRHGFPFGLRVKVKDGKASALAERLTDLRAEGWENLKAGVGRSREFAEGLLQHRLRVIVLTEEKASDLPRKAQPAMDWREARKLLQG